MYDINWLMASGLVDFIVGLGLAGVD